MPIYGSFYNDLTMKTSCKLVYAPFEGVDQFSSGSAVNYEKALLDASSKGIRVKALIICNPHNPLGSCYTVEALKELFVFCERYQLHLISDEIYALSVFRDIGTPFTSVLAIDPAGLVSHNRIHVLYGLSKDFGAAGLRLGCLITYNTNLLRATQNIGRFHCPSEVSCAIATSILEDRLFATEFIGKSRLLLSEHYLLATQILQQAGISYYDKGNAGFFLWIDLSPFLYFNEDEVNGSWAGEKDLSDRLLKAGVEMSTGLAYHNEKAGWFRVIFSVEREALEEGLHRIIRTININSQI
ncbi:ACC synthase [Phlyctema vagabunda]|uniref:ACC synthase n=1 Tax=Phlyctema vagabunda TaxID=108571 RepID=A0ABR4P4H4_9HELO